jgi:hypothetical protein
LHLATTALIEPAIAAPGAHLTHTIHASLALFHGGGAKKTAVKNFFTAAKLTRVVREG